MALFFLKWFGVIISCTGGARCIQVGYSKIRLWHRSTRMAESETTLVGCVRGRNCRSYRLQHLISIQSLQTNKWIKTNSKIFHFKFLCFLFFHFFIPIKHSTWNSMKCSLCTSEYVTLIKNVSITFTCFVRNLLCYHGFDIILRCQNDAPAEWDETQSLR